MKFCAEHKYGVRFAKFYYWKAHKIYFIKKVIVGTTNR